MTFSPRTSSKSTVAFAAADSPQPITYKLGFYGAGSTDADGNKWFKLMANNAGVSKLYVHSDGNSAIWDFLKAIDVNNSHIITAAEVSNLTLKVCGYSWGGISAIGFTQKIATSGTIVVGGTPHDPIEYRLEVGISVNQLVTIDPVEWLNPAGTVQNNVKAYQNWYQLKGGYSTFRDTPDVSEGNSFSAALKGDPVQVQAPLNYNTCNTRVDSPSWGTRAGQSFLIIDGDTKTYSLAGDETNHDGMPWLVGAAATSLMQ